MRIARLQINIVARVNDADERKSKAMMIEKITPKMLYMDSVIRRETFPETSLTLLLKTPENRSLKYERLCKDRYSNNFFTE